MTSEQKTLIQFDSPEPGFAVVNDHVSFTTEGSERDVSVHGIIFAHFDITDRPAAAYAMVSLIEAGYASPAEISRAFQVSARTIRRYQERLEKGGLTEIARPEGRPAEQGPDLARRQRRDQMILRLKDKGFSNRAVAGKLGVTEKMVRKRLRFLGWKAPSVPSLGFVESTEKQQYMPEIVSDELSTVNLANSSRNTDPSDKGNSPEPDLVIGSLDRSSLEN